MSNNTVKTGRSQKQKEKLTQWKKGQSGNLNGRPKLPKEIHEIKKEALEKAIGILANLVKNQEYIDSMDDNVKIKLLETVFDRFGLPKVTKQEMTGKDGEPLNNEFVVKYVKPE